MSSEKTLSLIEIHRKDAVKEESSRYATEVRDRIG